ncbi:hypothetical protein, partial [Cellulomonas sp. GbtcB1]|uniref:hypothetical protein n=1 Tax=Cellulomonas sp. GbtcB1 TaxID=2824746 RepID=UPI001C2F26C6
MRIDHHEGGADHGPAFGLADAAPHVVLAGPTDGDPRASLPPGNLTPRVSPTGEWALEVGVHGR